jgi:hypothetical protein
MSAVIRPIETAHATDSLEGDPKKISCKLSPLKRLISGLFGKDLFLQSERKMTAQKETKG